MLDDDKINIYLAIDESMFKINGDISYSCILKHKNKVKHITKNYNSVNSLTCTLLGFIDSILSLKRIDIPIVYFTNSYYLVNMCNRWLKDWKVNGWTLKSGKPPANLSMVRKIDTIISKLDISFRYIDKNNSPFIQQCIESCQ